MKPTLTFFTALLLAPLAWESSLGEDTTEMRGVNIPAKSSNPRLPPFCQAVAP
jgi:hypothetical protein